MRQKRLAKPKLSRPRVTLKKKAFRCRCYGPKLAHRNPFTRAAWWPRFSPSRHSQAILPNLPRRSWKGETATAATRLPFVLNLPFVLCRETGALGLPTLVGRPSRQARSTSTCRSRMPLIRLVRLQRALGAVMPRSTQSIFETVEFGRHGHGSRSDTVKPMKVRGWVLTHHEPGPKSAYPDRQETR